MIREFRGHFASVAAAENLTCGGRTHDDVTVGEWMLPREGVRTWDMGESVMDEGRESKGVSNFWKRKNTKRKKLRCVGRNCEEE